MRAILRLLPLVFSTIGIVLPQMTSAQRSTQIPPLYVAPARDPAAVVPDTVGLRFRVSEGTGHPAERPSVAPALLLPSGDADRILARLPALVPAPTAADSFAFPARTLPPPRAGRVTLAAFPAPDSAPPPRPGPRAPAPLVVVRGAPQGEVEVGAEVTVTFSQPMVPLSSVSQVESRRLPLRLSPQPEGSWRWLDVRTLVFTPRGRMPAATEYTVSIPAGTRSETGGVLAEAAAWTFRTPALTAVGGSPQGEPVRREPVIAIRFDQRIDRAAVLQRIVLRSGGRAFRVRAATAAEIASDPTARALSTYGDSISWIAFRPVEPLPADAEVEVVVPAGTPSAEGPLATAMDQSWRFRTFGPLRVTDARCSGRRGPCRPGTPFVFVFSNPLDTAAFHPSWVTVQPAIPGMVVSRHGSVVFVAGRTQPQTRYTVVVSPAVRDAFGQTLGREYRTTFAVGAPYPELAGFEQRMIVLDPLGPRRVSVVSHDHARLRVRIHRVQPEHWPEFQPNRSPSGAPAPLPGTEVENRVVRIAAGAGEMTETVVDLEPALRGGPGQLVVAVEGVEGEGDLQGTYAWVQSTRIGLAAMVDPGEVTAWATSLVDGAPLPGARITVQRASQEGATGADGTATVPLPPPDRSAGWIAARLGEDVALLPGGWVRREPGLETLWYGVTDRNLYRPGEEVKFKGWVRRFARAPDGGVQLPARAARAVVWRVRDPRGNEIAAGRAELTALGGFDGAFRVPEGSNLGYGAVELRLEEGRPEEGWSGAVGFQVQEFRRPEYEVTSEADEGPHVVGGSAEMSVRAAYFSGGALPGAPVTWELRSEPAWFTPPGWGEWRFGVMDGGYAYGGRPAETFRTRFEGTTDARGRHAVRVHFDAAEPPRAHTLVGEATVLDVNRQPWSTTTRMLVHPAEVYVGLRTERAWLQAGEPIEVSAVAVDLEGRTVPGTPIEVVAVRMDWRRDDRTGWSEVETADSLRCSVLSGANPVPCTFATGERGGRWRISATVHDGRGRPSLTRFDVWVYGGGTWRRGPGEERNAERRVTLVPDRERYAPGDTARILVQLPFWPARGILSVRREGLVRTQEIASAGPTTTVDVPVGEEDIPNLHLQVDVVGTYDRAGRRTPTARGTDFASGAVSLSVPPGPRTLQVTPTPADSVLAPDAETSVDVVVRDAAGRPVPDAEVVVVVVDEAVLALTGYRLGNPIDLFYPGWNPGVQDAGIRPWVVLADTAGGPGEVRGVVVDAQTRQPIAGAVVTVEGTAIRALTDASGRFRLAGVPAGTRTVRVTLMGLATAAQTVEMGAEPLPELHFELGVQAMELQEVVVAGAVRRERAGYEEDMAAAPAMAMPAPPSPDGMLQGKVGEGANAGGAIALRANFAALALWAPVVRTDGDGHARVPFTLPSNLTRYRVMAAAVQGGTRYGAGESSLTARQPLMVRPSAPRFLNYGDRFELPVVVQNQTDAPLDVEVAARGEGVRFTEPGKRVRVPAGDRVEVRIAAEAVRPGTATLQVAAVAGALSDAATITLPVYTPATAEAFATYGSIGGDSVVELPLRVPDDAIPAFGGLEVTTSSTALQELTDAFIYLVRYPYECSEQIASRLLAVAALRDVLTEFRAEGMPDPRALADSVARDLALLQSMQTGDGGFAFWPGGRMESWPYVSLHVTHALLRARAKGYPVDAGMLERAMEYVRRIDQHVQREGYPEPVRFALRAYGAYVLELAGDREAGVVLRRVMAGVRLDTIPLEPAGWLLAAVAEREPFAAQRAELLRIVNNRATETASTATFATAYEEGEYLLLHSSRRTDAVVLEALLRADPQNELVTKTVRGLLGHRTQGRWDNTQENAWVLLALDRYFRVYEGQTPEFVARVWLGERFAGDRRFVGRSADRHHLDVPMRVLVEDDPSSLAIGKEGPGRLYYRAGLRYAPRDLDLVPLERGFAIERAYEPMDDPGDVVRGEDGRWRVRAGARVRITLTVTAPSRRVHVAMVDPLPAGFEAVNTALLGAQNTPPEGERVRPAGRGRGGDYYYWWRTWYEHQNLRDDRVEAFTSLLPAGVYTYSYVARATTPGLFVVPPPRAEEMYSPETFGRGGTERVMVVAEDDAGDRE